MTAFAQGNKLLARQALPEALTLQTSVLDALGSTWHIELGHDAHAARRQALRTVVAEYCHAPLQGQQVLNEGVHTFYEEKDWMLENSALPMTTLMPLASPYMTNDDE